MSLRAPRQGRCAPGPTVPAHGPRATARSRPSAAAAAGGSVAGEARTCADRRWLARGAGRQAAHRRRGGGAAQRPQPPARAGDEPHCGCGAAPGGPARRRRDAVGFGRPPARATPAAPRTRSPGDRVAQRKSSAPGSWGPADARAGHAFWRRGPPLRVEVSSGSTRPCGLMSSLELPLAARSSPLMTVR